MTTNDLFSPVTAPAETSNTELVEAIQELQDSVELLLTAGCPGCNWAGPWWRLKGGCCPECGHATVSAFEAAGMATDEPEGT